jgi:hypothetical protein
MERHFYSKQKKYVPVFLKFVITNNKLINDFYMKYK